MLSRYQMKRGVPAAQLPRGLRQDARMHTHHVLRPERDAVEAYLAGTLSWAGFAARYRALVHERYRAEPAPFDELAAKARTGDVYLGCS